MLRNAENKLNFISTTECFGRKDFDYVTSTHQKQAAYHYELGIFVQVTGRRLGRNEESKAPGLAEYTDPSLTEGNPVEARKQNTISWPPNPNWWQYLKTNSLF